MSNFDLYNKLAPFYDVLKSGNRNYNLEVDFFSTLFSRLEHEEKIKTILELGCATGEYINRLRQKGWPIDGIDFSEEMINVAKRKCPDAFFYPQNFLEFNKIGAYNVILAAQSIISFLVDDGDLMRFFKHMQALKPRFIIVDIQNYDIFFKTHNPNSQLFHRENENFIVSGQCLRYKAIPPLHRWFFSLRGF